ncbi:DUF3078 domain-containing protein [Parvicella tangerina]|uniref:DUF3078 domain-containing protein n=1 Tax=Parvicella tangerina TaxID=2829795 RepID=A0A916JKW2_9FLAO|nr:DUF3078 domain-containing protein [Parvicella tangerina]CAG5077727.1 hypothetical protein CRYO30217_00467 [Parvicella tangerina]
MRKIVIVLLSTFLFSASIYGQFEAEEKKLKSKAKGSSDSTKTWDVGGNVNLNATQVALSNWAGGGESSLSLQGLFGVYANYSKGKSAWDNSLDLAYGMIKSGKADWFKNDDRIELNSKYGHKASEHWYYAALLNFRTQFVEGYSKVGDLNYISNFMSPGYLTVALGMDYKPNKKLTMFFSPATLKMTAVLDDSLAAIGAFGVDDGQNIRNEFGGYLKATFNEPKVFGNENLSFKSSLALFSNYNEKPQNIDVNWDATLTAKVAKYFTVSLSLNMIYDDDIDIQRYNSDGTPVYILDSNNDAYLDGDGNPIKFKGPITQLKEVLALGFAYKF